MRELDKAVNHINNEIFYIDMRTEAIENRIQTISDKAATTDNGTTVAEERMLAKLRNTLRRLFDKKEDLMKSLEILHKYV